MQNGTATQEPMTLEKLAEMIAAGFEQTATKEDIRQLREELGLVDGRLSTVEQKLDKALYKEIVRLEEKINKRKD